MTRAICSVVAALALAAAAIAQPRQAVVAADHPAASEAGAEMLRRGGNAVDAAVATSFALAVVAPQSCGIGGGGFMLVRLADDPRTADEGDAVSIAIDYRERAPEAVGPDFFNDKPSDAARYTGAAVGVPGTVAGLFHALDNYGTLDRATVLAPAIRLAEEGFTVTEDLASSAAGAARWYGNNQERREAEPLLWKTLLGEGELEAGSTIKNPAMAATLRRIADEGAAGFYEGPVAEAIVDTAQGAGGVMTLQDLAAYEPAEREPLVGSFRGRTIVTMPPSSSGGVATLQTLALLERFEAANETTLEDLGHNTPEYLHAFAEAVKHAFAERNALLGDPDHADVPVDDMLAADRLDTMAARMTPGETLRPDEYGYAAATAPPPDDDGTSHISVVDAAGNAVACTETINLAFGARLAVDEHGFVLNNQMDDFTTVSGRANAFGLVQSDANLPAPGKRPLSSMSPTIVLGEDGAVELVAGAAGGPRIITATLQTVLNAIVFGLPAQEAVDAPRVHHQLWPPFLSLEPRWDLRVGIDPELPAEEIARIVKEAPEIRRFRLTLTSMGHSINRAETNGAVQAVVRTEDGYVGASDKRRSGAPAGLD